MMKCQEMLKCQQILKGQQMEQLQLHRNGDLGEHSVEAEWHPESESGLHPLMEHSAQL
jgi:hypothetical protein